MVKKNHASVASTQKKHHRNPEGILSAWRKSITFFCGFLYTRNQRLRLNDARHPGRTWPFSGDFEMSPPTVFPRLATLKIFKMIFRRMGVVNSWPVFNTIQNIPK